VTSSGGLFNVLVGSGWEPGGGGTEGKNFARRARGGGELVLMVMLHGAVMHFRPVGGGGWSGCGRGNKLGRLVLLGCGKGNKLGRLVLLGCGRRRSSVGLAYWASTVLIGC
jgi:hypothetical protein